MDFYSLGGVLVASPKKIDSRVDEVPDFVFVNNIYCKKQHEILEKLGDFHLATTSTWNTVLQIFVKYSGNTSINIPCINCPERLELEARGLPTFLMSPI